MVSTMHNLLRTYTYCCPMVTRGLLENEYIILKRHILVKKKKLRDGYDV